MMKQAYFRADISNLAGHSARNTWIGELVQCGCGHGIGKDWLEGCTGDFRGACACRMTRSNVIDVAISEARFANVNTRRLQRRTRSERFERFSIHAIDAER